MENLGIDGLQMLSQIVSFLVILYLLKRFLYQPFLKVLDEREQRIKDSLANADKIEKELASVEARQKEILKKAREQANQVVLKAQKAAEETSAQIVQAAEAAAQKKLDNAVKAIRQEELDATDRIKRQAFQLAQEMTKKALTLGLDSASQTKLVDQAIGQLSKLN